MRKISRREILRFTGAAAGMGVLARTSAMAQDEASTLPKKPNIIFILADDLGYGDLRCYGQTQIQTPNLDRMASEGIRFTQCYAGSTVCAPSRCCLMTGLHTGHARIRGNALVPLEPEDVTVAEVLHEAGYATGLIGKWGLGEPDTTGLPNKQGFDYFFGYLNQRHAHNYYPEYLWRNEEQVRLEGNKESPERKGVAVKRGQYSHDLFAEEALQFIKRSKERPFFLYLALTTPHANNEAGKEGMEVPSQEPYGDKAWPEPEKGKAAMITRMDKDVGRVFQLLKDKGLDERTIVFFSSDNGPHKEGGAEPDFFRSSGPLRGIKRALYEGGIRVPMLVRWPGVIKPGAVSDAVWTFWDFLPTAAELAGAQTPQGLDGLSVVPALLGQPRETQEFLYWEFHEGASKQAVRMGNWKAVRLKPREPLELYDLGADIGETHDVAKEHPDVIAKIEAFLEHARTESKDWPLQGGGKAT